MKPAAWGAAALACLHACALPATSADPEWPAGRPPREEFVRAWSQDAQNARVQPLEEYLAWVARFYEGAGGQAGWNARTRQLLRGEPPELEERFRELGRLLSAEWAKDNGRRRVTTAMLSVWGGVMRRGRAQGRLPRTVERLLGDARALAAGSLGREAIVPARYEDLVAAGR